MTRQTKIDEMFPKEITKQSPQYYCERDYFGGFNHDECSSPGEDDIVEAIANYLDEYVTYEHVQELFDGGLTLDLIATEDFNADDGELARRRVHLSLSIEIIEGEG